MDTGLANGGTNQATLSCSPDFRPLPFLFHFFFFFFNLFFLFFSFLRSIRTRVFPRPREKSWDAHACCHLSSARCGIKDDQKREIRIGQGDSAICVVVAFSSD